MRPQQLSPPRLLIQLSLYFPLELLQVVLGLETTDNGGFELRDELDVLAGCAGVGLGGESDCEGK